VAAAITMPGRRPGRPAGRHQAAGDLTTRYAQRTSMLRRLSRTAAGFVAGCASTCRRSPPDAPRRVPSSAPTRWFERWRLSGAFTALGKRCAVRLWWRPRTIARSAAGPNSPRRLRTPRSCSPRSAVAPRRTVGGRRPCTCTRTSAPVGPAPSPRPPRCLAAAVGRRLTPPPGPPSHAGWSRFAGELAPAALGSGSKPGDAVRLLGWGLRCNDRDPEGNFTPECEASEILKQLDTTLIDPIHCGPTG
jgi:hypothetical protein